MTIWGVGSGEQGIDVQLLRLLSPTPDSRLPTPDISAGGIMKLQFRFWRAVCSILIATAALTITVVAQQAANKSTGQPPLIDRELFFGNPEIAGAQISPDGKFIAFLKPYKDT